MNLTHRQLCKFLNSVFSRIMCMSVFFFLIGFSYSSICFQRGPYPLQFSIPEIKIVCTIPEKDKDFAFIIPGDLRTYIYQQESDYYKDYQRSYFAITCCKGGWDCMRHYEILANGCIPYFLDLDKCNPNTMYFLPKDLIKEAMNLPGISYLKIDHAKFDKVRYYEILNKLLEHTKQYLTTKNMAQYILNTINYTGSGKILYLSQQVSPDYMREVVLIGLKEIFPQSVIDYPKIDFLYKSYSRRYYATIWKRFYLHQNYR